MEARRGSENAGVTVLRGRTRVESAGAWARIGSGGSIDVRGAQKRAEPLG